MYDMSDEIRDFINKYFIDLLKKDLKEYKK